MPSRLASAGLLVASKISSLFLPDSHVTAGPIGWHKVLFSDSLYHPIFILMMDPAAGNVVLSRESCAALPDSVAISASQSASSPIFPLDPFPPIYIKSRSSVYPFSAHCTRQPFHLPFSIIKRSKFQNLQIRKFSICLHLNLQHYAYSKLPPHSPPGHHGPHPVHCGQPSSSSHQ